MSWILLAFAVLSALFTLNAWRPFRVSPAVGAVAFFAGWLTSELPLHHILWQLAAVAAMVLLGGADELAGQAGLAIVTLSWGGLIGCHLTALATREEVTRALAEALGEEAGRLPTPTPVDWQRVALPSPSARRRVRRVKDVVYAEAGGVRLKLDIYHRKDRPAGRPVLLQLHGGAWIFGRKDDQALPLMNRAADDGWVCVSANYRLSPRFTFPDAMIDVKRAIAWVREHIHSYGGDPSFLVLTGGSAGGHLCALAALTPNDPEYQPGFEDVDTSVKGCLPFYGIYDFTNDAHIWHPRGLPRLLERRVLKTSIEADRGAWVRASPYHRAGPQAPPFFIVHGAADTLVPVREARRFAEHLRAASAAPVAYLEVPGAQHAFEVFPSVRTELVVDGATRFLAWLWGDAAEDAGDDRPGTRAAL